MIMSNDTVSSVCKESTHVKAKPVDALELHRVAVDANDLGPRQPDGALGRLRAAVAFARRRWEGGAAHVDENALAAVLEDGLRRQVGTCTRVQDRD